MKSTREWKKQHDDKVTPLKSHQNSHKHNVNPCGSCNSCHQMSRIQLKGNSPIWGGNDDGTPGQNPPKPCAINFLQRNLGNSYMQSSIGGGATSEKITVKNSSPKIQRKCSCGGSCGKEDEEKRIQAKVKIGPANDVYEQEADRVADIVMRMPEPKGQAESDYPHLGMQIQRLSNSDTAGFAADSNLNQCGGHPLSAETRHYMEPRFGIDFGNVRVHTDQQSHRKASDIQARAFTYGQNIWLGKGECEQNKKLIAHELTHVMQQRNGSIPHFQRWSYGAGTHATSGGNTLREVIDPDERERANGMDAAMAIVDRLVNGTNWRARNCQGWFTDNCLDPRTLTDLHNRAVIWMWREADGSSGNGLTDGGNRVHHAVTEQLFNIRSRWALAATIIHEYWHDCDTGAPDDIGDDAKAACGLPNI